MDLNHPSQNPLHHPHDGGGGVGGVALGGGVDENDYSYGGVQTSGGNGGREESRGVIDDGGPRNAWYDTDL